MHVLAVSLGVSTSLLTLPNASISSRRRSLAIIVAMLVATERDQPKALNPSLHDNLLDPRRRRIDSRVLLRNRLNMSLINHESGHRMSPEISNLLPLMKRK